MDFLIAFILIVAGLFASVFFTKRHFGLLGLALAAGSILSGLWAYDGGLVAGLFGMPSNPITSTVVSVVILVLPAVLLLFHGEKYKTVFGRTIGAMLFAVLAASFLIEPLSRVMNPEGLGQDIVKWFSDYKSLIVGFGLVFAVADLFLAKSARLSSKHHKH